MRDDKLNPADDSGDGPAMSGPAMAGPGDVAAVVASLVAWAAGRPELGDPWLTRHAGPRVAGLLREAAGAGPVPVAVVTASGDTFGTRTHAAVLVGSGPGARVVDATARQFAATAPVPWVGPVTTWGQLVAEWLADHVHLRVGDPDPGATGTSGGAGFLVYRPAGPGVTGHAWEEQPLGHGTRPGTADAVTGALEELLVAVADLTRTGT